jgi:hypothetical protein
MENSGFNYGSTNPRSQKVFSPTLPTAPVFTQSMELAELTS